MERSRGQAKGDEVSKLTVAHSAKLKGFARNLELLRKEPRKFKTLKDAQEHTAMMRALEIEYAALLQLERNEAVKDRDRADLEAKQRAETESKLRPMRQGKGPSAATRELRRLVECNPKAEPKDLWGNRNKEHIPEARYDAVRWGKKVHKARKWLSAQHIGPRRTLTVRSPEIKFPLWANDSLLCPKAGFRAFLRTFRLPHRVALTHTRMLTCPLPKSPPAPS